MNHNVKKIGLVIGKGTAPELSEIFKDFIEYFVKKLTNYQVKFIENEKPFDSFWSLKDGENYEDIREQAVKDKERLWKLFLKFKNKGVKSIFRTAINAESLYIFRQKAEAIKEFEAYTRYKEQKILIIRDETQGFYTNDNYALDKNTILIETSFKKENFEQVIQYSQQQADKKFGKGNYRLWAFYKYHLFANLIDNWVKEIAPNLKIYQPDTGLSNFLSYINGVYLNGTTERKPLVLIVSNEIGDIIYEFVIALLNLGNKNELFTKNIYLNEELNRPTVYQTVHGSADDIAGKNKVNPIATLRIAAEILENEFQILHFKRWVNVAITEAKINYKESSAIKGAYNTRKIAFFVKEQIKKQIIEKKPVFSSPETSYPYP